MKWRVEKKKILKKEKKRKTIEIVQKWKNETISEQIYTKRRRSKLYYQEGRKGRIHKMDIKRDLNDEEEVRAENKIV